jgi:hypothetical protein
MLFLILLKPERISIACKNNKERLPIAFVDATIIFAAGLYYRWEEIISEI